MKWKREQEWKREWKDRLNYVSRVPRITNILGESE